GEPGEEQRLEILAGEQRVQLERAVGVAQDLRRLEARELVEEPAAARVHELAVALKLEEAQRAQPLGGVERAGALGLEEAVAGHAGIAVAEDGDVAIARAPRIAHQRRGLRLEERGGAIAHEVERAAERR